MNFRFFFIFIFLLLTNNSFAMSLIRDDEIEKIIKEIAYPIVKAAKLNPNILKIYIINDKSLNAFTAGGTNIFIHTGLISEFDDPSIIQGVLAHEIGHVIAGHVTQKMIKMREMQKNALIGSVIGVLGGIASKSSDVAMGGLVGSSMIAQREMLSFSRQHENEADHIALDLLHKAKASNKGLVKLLKTLMLKQSFISSEPYLLTHPLGQWRLDHIYSYKYQDDNENNFTQSQLERFKRAVYKLRAYTYPPDTILAKYNGNDFISYYARVIAIFRKGQKQEAENKIDLLVSDYPKDPYLLEIKGQIFMENGDFTTSTKTYKEALRQEPSSNLLKFQLAVSEINLASKTNDQNLLKDSILLLNQIIDTNDQTSMTYHYLSVAYGKLGDIGNAKLALAEKFFLLDKKPETEKFANQALKYLKPGSSSYIRANDLLSDLKHNKK